ncbi:hypothetical protein LO763_14550 [Glycomyces sp. A-F 0318]|uniref:hypothetical protein n=1 Tax=Glycomyces amatae TaxID=2881355 RepID=UPI001E42A5EE|nr:hypothetical protein [Glycomyces amatae]MCD0444835.1 hypothetical protein [Glycomyces amatae]
MSTTAKRTTKGRKAFMAATAVAAAAGAITLPVQGAAAAETGAPQACAIETLPIPEGLRFTFVTGMSDDGSVVAYRAYPADHGYERYPLLYADGEVTEVPIPGEDQQIADVNASGDGAGFTFLDGVVPYAWRDGALVELAAEDGGEANGINERGDIAGARGQYPQVPVVWPAGGEKPVDLPLPEGAGSGTATDIGEDGTVVGYYEDAEGDFTPYAWDADGTGAHLPLPDGVDPATAHAYVSDLNGDWASGYLSAPGLDGVGVVWNLAEGTAEVTGLGGPVAVSAKGTAAGDAFPHAAYQDQGGKPVELPGVWDPAENYFGDRADQISADGSVIAGNVYAGEDADGRHVLNAVVWDCD